MNFCTWFPEGWWSTCCEIHDKAYADQIVQLIADKALFLCVATSGTNVFEMIAGLAIASVMFIGVRVFGKHYYNKSK
jgi:hypothetical protein